MAQLRTKPMRNAASRFAATPLLLLSALFDAPQLPAQPQPPAPQPIDLNTLLQAELPYSGDLREEDPRADDLRRALRQGGDLPEGIRLRFSRIDATDLIFYDYVGSEIRYRYRDSRFDPRPNRRIRNLIPGQAYLVRGELIGLHDDGVWIRPDDESYRDRLDDRNIRLYLNYNSATPLRLEQILIN